MMPPSVAQPLRGAAAAECGPTHHTAALEAQALGFSQEPASLSPETSSRGRDARPSPHTTRTVGRPAGGGPETSRPPPTPVLTGPMSPPQSGVLSSLPFVAASTCTVLGGQLADFLLSRGLLRLVTVRKLFSCLGEGRRSPRPRAVRAGPSAGSDTAPPAQGCSSRRSVPWPCPSPPPAT